MLRRILRTVGIWPYLKHFKKRFFPSRDQQNETNFISERIGFYKQFINPGDLCFDIGANLGNRTEIFLKLGARVVAVEPQHECAKLLKLRFGNAITLIPYALGERVGKGVMFVSETAELSSLSQDWIASVSTSRFKNKRWDRKQEVQITTLDAVIGQYGLPEFCKIDVEGFEEEVLRGLSRIIPTISFEYTIPERLNSVVHCLDRLSSLGNFSCNYSIGENIQLECTSWVSKEELIIQINERSSEILFGDIYIKFHS